MIKIMRIIKMTGRIYRRKTLKEKNSKRKQKDEKARIRNTIFNFRVTPEEKKMIEERIRVSGLSRAEFFLQSSLFQQINVIGSIRTSTEMQKSIDSMSKILQDYLHDKTNPEDLNEVLQKENTEFETYLTLTAYKTTIEILKSLNNEAKKER